MDRKRVQYGAQAQSFEPTRLPTSFPRTMEPNCAKYLQEVVDSGLTSNTVQRFEIAFADELGMAHCIATPGCTPALTVLAAAFNFQVGDEIIVSPVTDFGTGHGLIRENYIPIFPDTELGSINMGAATIEPCISDRTCAILVVHKTGIICDMDSINKLAARHDLIVYEDDYQAVFGRYKGRYASTLSKAAGFSFDSEKTLGSDVGGYIVIDDDRLAEKARLIGQCRGGQIVPNFSRTHTINGFAHRMTLSTAAITLVQLEIIKPQVAQRDRMVRVPDITPLPIPEYLDVYSCWMVGFSIHPEAFRCSAEAFAAELAQAGIPGTEQGRYYLMPARIDLSTGDRRTGDLSLFTTPRTAAISLYRR